MKKKVLSFILTAAMLSSMLVHPMTLVASEIEEGVEAEIVLDETESEEVEEAEVDAESEEIEDAEEIDAEEIDAEEDFTDDTEEFDAEDFEEIIDEDEDGFIGENELLEGGATTVTEIELFNIVEPSPMSVPSDSYSAGDSSKYTVVKMEWYDYTENSILADEEMFEQGHNYLLYVYLKPTSSKYEFPANKDTMNATINGKSVNSCQPSDIAEAEVKLVKRYHCAVVLNEAKIVDVVEPVALQSPNYTYPAPDTEGGEYDISLESFDEGELNGITWYNESDDVVMSEEDVFEAGKEYTVKIKVEVNEGFVFPSHVMIAGSINGEKANVADSELYTQRGQQIEVSKTFVCEKADPVLVFENSTLDKKYGCRSFKVPLTTSETDGELTYTSSDDAVAEVDEITGVIRVKKDGVAVITCKSAETDTYKAGSVTCTLTISPLPTLTQPAKPTLAATRAGVRITWKAVAGAEKYRVFRKTGSSGWERVATTTATNCADTNVVSGATYTYTVRCINDDETVYMSTYDKKGSSITFVAAPAITELTNLEKGIMIEWNEVDGAGKYRVFYREQGATSWSKAGDTTTTSLEFTKLTKGKVYEFTVRCMNSAGTAFVSAYDPVGKSITYTPEVVIPDEVELVSVTAGTDSITVRWSAAPKATKYRVYRRKWNETTWTGIATVSSGSTVTYTDKKAVKGIKYYYTVRSFSDSGYSTDYDRTGLAAMIRLATPQISSLTNSSKGITLKWNAVSGASKYRIMRKNTSGNWAKVADVTGTSYTVAVGLTSGSTYSFTIRCISSDSSYYTSAYNSTGKSLLYLQAPTTTASTVSNGIRVTWTTISGATGYEIYRRTSGTSWTLLAKAKTGSVYSLVDQKASTSVNYYYMVRATRGDVISGYNSSSAVSR